jgi:hypothetical protein
MTGLSVILGIVLIALMLRTPPLSGRALKLWLLGIALFYAGSTAMIAMGASEPDRVAYLVGRAVGAYVLLLLFVAVGSVIRNRRAKRTP